MKEISGTIRGWFYNTTRGETKWYKTDLATKI